MTHSDSRIQAALGIGLWERLDELSDDALTENPDSGLAIYAKGIAAMRRREYIEARGHFEVALSRDPNVPNFSHGLAICDFVDNNVQSAENRIRSVLQSHPDYFDGQLFLCWILAKSHQTSRAEIEIRAALTSQPEHPSLLEALLYLRRNVERRRDTEELTRRLLAANPESVTGHLCLADSLLRNNRPAEAAEEIRYCLSKLPRVEMRHQLQRLLTVAKLMQHPLGGVPLLCLTVWAKITKVFVWPKIRRIGREPKFNR